MKKLLFALLFLVIGFVAGNGFMLIVFPYIFPPAQVNEAVKNVATKSVYATGTFIHPNPSDPVHYGKGNVSIYFDSQKHEIYLHNNFEVGPGPALYIYLSESSNIKTKSDFNNAKNFELEKLKSFKGSQVYKVPSNVDIKKIKSVVVWCRAFKQLITSANLHRKK